MKDCKTWNKAMLFRIMWDIHSNKNNLWIMWIYAVYLRRKGFWTWSHGRDDHTLFKNITGILWFHPLVQSTMQSSSLIRVQEWQFLTSSAYEWLRHKRLSRPWMSFIWKNYIPPKHSFILWQAMRGRLNTKDLWLSVSSDSCCVFCKRHP